ncbi:hypothetical protein SMACR_05414 [Sordaria macrospora]|uniref:WGS project CABT00000000 data, contig 2.6 n=2 Tax=Sordaria macrospora TaxID=5147 RepID=F7VSV7_SORMK|nr:uncharacterized protein SMAC_05414 [Sordaria macrospora k-hell]KAA8630693.1 hypothetical protein SMACR_05414 [Sordaria macrospora]WPJ57594.1 hypothetical protein SMAC4_05414 [Sordaria macrospora]CCC08774.1 unnamed protein product [Sordaria macrospora k-hell]
MAARQSLWTPPKEAEPGLWNPGAPKLWSPRERSQSTSTVSSVFSASNADGRIRYPGRRFAQIVKLKPEYIGKYKESHAAVWPEVAKQIKECNIQDYSIFHDPGTGILFASFKYVGYDYEGDMEKMRENPKVREWWKMTDGFQESMVPGAKNSESGEPSWWKPVEEVFYQA